MLVELLLGGLDGLGEILVGQLGIDNDVAVLGQEGWFDASWNRLPAVEEEDDHGGIVADLALSVNHLDFASFWHCEGDITCNC